MTCGELFMLTHKTLSYITLLAMTHPWTCFPNLKWSSPRMDQPTHLSCGPVSLTLFHEEEKIPQSCMVTWLIRYLAVSDFKRYLISTFSKSVTRSQYYMVIDFVRYYTRTTISHVCRFWENTNISCADCRLQIAWDITL